MGMFRDLCLKTLIKNLNDTLSSDYTFVSTDFELYIYIYKKKFLENDMNIRFIERGSYFLKFEMPNS